jgi:hypothetical protein
LRETLFSPAKAQSGSKAFLSSPLLLMTGGGRKTLTELFGDQSSDTRMRARRRPAPEALRVVAISSRNAEDVTETPKM